MGQFLRLRMLPLHPDIVTRKILVPTPNLSPLPLPSPRSDLRCEISPRSLKFKKNKYGKPEVDWQCDDQWVPPSLHFNISHTSSLIACGVTLDVPIGIDIEEKQRRLKSGILSFARRYFSTFEIEFLQAIADPEYQRQEFVKL